MFELLHWLFASGAGAQLSTVVVSVLISVLKKKIEWKFNLKVNVVGWWILRVQVWVGQRVWESYTECWSRKKQLRRTHLMWQQTNNKKGLRDGKTCQECQYLDSIFLSLDRVKTVDRVDMQWCVSVTFTSLNSNCRHTNTLHCVCMYTIWMICPLPVKISTRYLLVEAGYDAKKRHQVKVDKSVQCTLLSTFTCALCLITQLPGPLCLWQCPFL